MLTDRPRFPVASMIGHGWLPSFLKVTYYRLKGYKINRGVKLAFGSVIIGKEVTIGEDTQVSFFSFIRGKAITLGKRVRIGAMSILDTPIISIGDDTKINEQVYVGGLVNPDSEFVVGRNSQIQQLTFINPARKVSIGDETSIGGHSLIFTHQSWQNVLDGYATDFRPVTIGNHVGVAWRVFISAGAKIGDGSMIGTNSLVNRTIPPGCLATGSPAKVVAKAPYFPRTLTLEDKERIFNEIISEFIAFLSGHQIECAHEADLIRVRWKPKGFLKNRTRRASIAISKSNPPLEADPLLDKDVSVYLSLFGIPEDRLPSIEARNIVWFDLQEKTRSTQTNDLAEETAQFLRRHGLRFNRA